MASWSGAPPVSREGFTFINNEFFAETSNQNRHRRATHAELKAIFDTPGADKEKPAHWFEAQLIHYGLPVSKTKSVAWKRLFEGVREGKLAVPPATKRLEADLKKEWTKNDRELKKEGGSATTAAPVAAAKGKRKADDAGDAGPAKKTKAGAVKEEKPKATATKAAASKTPAATPKKAAEKKLVAETKTATEKKPTERKQTARRGGSTAASGRGGITLQSPPVPVPELPVAPRGRTKQTARYTGPPRGAPNAIASSSRTAGAASSPHTYPGPVPSHLVPFRNTARRGSGWDRNRARILPSGNYDPNDLPPPYSGSMSSQESDSYYDNDDDAADDNQPPPSSNEVVGPLGLLNGHYSVISPTVSGEWPRMGTDFNLSLVISGSELWGSFDLGIVSGILRFEQRPYRSSTEDIEFTWRGRENEGQIYYGDNNKGWMRFLGDGNVFGELDYMKIEFSGIRDQGQGTRSDVSVGELRAEWNGYSEEVYERENRGRWGRSGW